MGRKLYFSPNRKQKSTGVSHGSQKVRKQIANKKYYKRRKNKKIHNLKIQNNIYEVAINDINNILIDKNEEIKSTKKMMQDINNDSKLWEYNTAILQSDLNNNCEEQHEYSTDNNDNEQTDNDTFNKIIDEIINKLDENLFQFDNMQKNIKYGNWMKILFINLRKYCTSMQIIPMIKDVLQLLSEYIQTVFETLGNSNFFIKLFISFLNILQSFLPTTKTVCNWVTIYGSKICSIHSAFYIIKKLKQQQKTQCLHIDGGSIEDKSFEIIGLTGKNVNIKTDNEMVSDFEVLKEFIDEKKYKIKCKEKFYDHVLGAPEVYIFILYILKYIDI